jgi:hypothetical protein
MKIRSQQIKICLWLFFVVAKTALRREASF